MNNQKKLNSYCVYLFLLALSCLQAVYANDHDTTEAVVIDPSLALGESGARASNWTYTVRPGDTIWSICQRFSYYENCWRELGDYNSIDQARAMSIGSKIVMPLDWLQAPLEAASIAHLVGEVSIVRGRQEISSPSAGDVLEIGDRIVLGEGELVIQFADGSKMILDPETELTIDAVSAIKQTRQSEIEVSLPRGSARVNVKDAETKNIFRVRTTTGVAAVRGTVFRVRNDDQMPVTRTEVLEGNVDYSAQQKTVELAAGFGTLAERGKAPRDPVGLLPAPEWLPQCDIPELVEWGALDGADFYILEVLAEDTSTTRTLARVQASNSYHEFKDLDDGCYRLRVQGVQNGFYGMDSEREYCYQKTIGTPSIKVASLTAGQLHVEITPAANADEYLIEFSDARDFAGSVQSLQLTELLYDGAVGRAEGYQYARVKALSDDGLTSSPSESVEVKQEQERGVIWVILGVLAVFALL